MPVMYEACELRRKMIGWAISCGLEHLFWIVSIGVGILPPRIFAALSIIGASQKPLCIPVSSPQRTETTPLRLQGGLTVT